MTGMSTPYEAVGRTRQKSRTREALVAAARDLVAQGVSPTIEQTAGAAGISRATAYRYFPHRAALLAAAHPETDAASMLGEHPPEDAAARLDEVLRVFTTMIVETEAQQRTMLRLSLEADAATVAGLPLRQGRAIGWIGEALAGLEDELGEPAVRHLVLAIRSAVGIEALVWLTDVAGLTRDDAVELMRWSAQSLLAAARATGVPALQSGSGTSVGAVSATRGA